MKIRLGKVDYLNCLPVYNAIETGRVPLEVDLIKGVPTRLNTLFMTGELDITPVSSIEYARHPDRCIILPNVSISADGRVGSIFLFSRVPIKDLNGKKVCLPDTSATSVALLKILFHHYYKIDAVFETVPDDLELMLSRADAGLLIGDRAMVTNHQVRTAGKPLHITDLGSAWKEFTGLPMTFALWVIRRDFAARYPSETDAVAQAFLTAKRIGHAELDRLVDIAQQKVPLPRDVMEDYFNLIKHDLDTPYRKGLTAYYQYAFQTGLLAEPAPLIVWGE